MPTPTYAHVASLGSSFAAGPGIKPVDHRMALRSGRNYPHLLAERLGARLTDLTVSGATTATILDVPQRVVGRRFPPQVSGLSPDVDLVTVTAGGNDMNYIGAMLQAAYAGRLSRRAVTRRLGRRLGRGGVPRPQTTSFDAAADGLADIVRAARTRAPHARVVLVSYLTVLEPDAPCTADIPFTPDVRDALLATADGLSQAFATAAAATGAELVDVARHSRGHGLGGPQPWVRGFSPLHPATSFHPTSPVCKRWPTPSPTTWPTPDRADRTRHRITGEVAMPSRPSPFLRTAFSSDRIPAKGHECGSE